MCTHTLSSPCTYTCTRAHMHTKQTQPALLFHKYTWTHVHIHSSRLLHVCTHRPFFLRVYSHTCMQLASIQARTHLCPLLQRYHACLCAPPTPSPHKRLCARDLPSFRLHEHTPRNTLMCTCTHLASSLPCIHPCTHTCPPLHLCTHLAPLPAAQAHSRPFSRCAHTSGPSPSARTHTNTYTPPPLLQVCAHIGTLHTCGSFPGMRTPPGPLQVRAHHGFSAPDFFVSVPARRARAHAPAPARAQPIPLGARGPHRREEEEGGEGAKRRAGALREPARRPRHVAAPRTSRRPTPARRVSPARRRLAGQGPRGRARRRDPARARAPERARCGGPGSRGGRGRAGARPGPAACARRLRGSRALGPGPPASSPPSGAPGWPGPAGSRAGPGRRGPGRAGALRAGLPRSSGARAGGGRGAGAPGSARARGSGGPRWRRAGWGRR